MYRCPACDSPPKPKESLCPCVAKPSAVPRKATVKTSDRPIFIGSGEDVEIKYFNSHDNSRTYQAL